MLISKCGHPKKAIMLRSVVVNLWCQAACVSEHLRKCYVIFTSSYGSVDACNMSCYANEGGKMHMLRNTSRNSTLSSVVLSNKDGPKLRRKLAHGLAQSN